MSNGLGRIEWKQNNMHLSEVYVRLNYSAENEIEFFLDEAVVNHLFQKRSEEIEMHLKLDAIDNVDVFAVDFSKLKRVKPVYPLLQQNLTLPEIEKSSVDDMEKAGTYAILHKDSMTWLGKEGWTSLRREFDIIPKKNVETFLSVTLIPREAVEAGAMWRVKEGSWQNSAASLAVTTGRYFLEFKEISGWNHPPPEQVQVVEGIDENISIEYSVDEPNFPTKKVKFTFLIFLMLLLSTAGLYFGFGVKKTGTIVADLSPTEITRQGAKWRADNGDWQESGTLVKLESGEHLIEFMPVDGWEGPKKQKVTIKKDQNTQVEVSYLKLLAVYLTPQEAVLNGAQWKLSTDDQWLSSGDKVAIPTGNRHEIVFKEIENWIVPEQKIIPDNDSTLKAQYTKKPPEPVALDRSITIAIGPAEANQDGAQWKLEGPGKWKSSGETLSGLISIPYTVIFRDIAGWKRPGNLKITVKEAGNITKEVIYKKLMEPLEDDRQ